MLTQDNGTPTVKAKKKLLQARIPRELLQQIRFIALRREVHPHIVIEEALERYIATEEKAA